MQALEMSQGEKTDRPMSQFNASFRNVVHGAQISGRLTAMRRKLIYIVERNLFVSEDMTCAIRALMPEAQCAVFASVFQARMVSEGQAQPDMIFVSANADGRLDVSEKDLAWLRNLPVVAFDLGETQDYPGWQHLAKPFTEAQIASAVWALRSEAQSTAAE